MARYNRKTNPMKSRLSILFILLSMALTHAQFGPQELIATLDEAFSVHASDIDGDGDMDIFAAGMFSNRIIWFKNLDGAGNFGSENIIDDNAYLPQSVFGADLDGDGDIDLAVGKYAGAIVTWYENLDGTGNFGPEQMVSDNGEGVWQAIPADADGDGDPDLFINAWSADKISWFENIDGQGNFGPEQIISNSLLRPTGIAVADLDGDGDLDAVSTSHNDNKVAWYENTDGQGTFGAEQLISTSVTQASRIQVGDIDGDGDTDLVVTSYNNNIFFWFENTDGQGNFATPRTIDTNQTDNIHLSDLDQDGDLDILSTHNNAIAYYENMDGHGNFGSQQLITTEVLAANQAIAADLDGDGMPDVLSVSRHDDKVAWHENLGKLGTEDHPTSNISVYPNPTNDNITIDLAAEYPKVSIEIYTVLGKMISSEEYTSAKIIRRAVNFPSGIYILKIQISEALIRTTKLIKD